MRCSRRLQQVLVILLNVATLPHFGASRTAIAQAALSPAGSARTPGTTVGLTAANAGASITDLGALCSAYNSLAQGIDNARQIVGLSSTASGPFHAVRWQSAGSPPLDLGAL